jgi:phosphoglycolate phosphatase-like HAD superfamily hydrolase
MKPNPEPVMNALNALAVQPQSSVLIGDSLADITAGQAAGVPVIGYANRLSKKERFANARADAVVTSMADVVAALRGGNPDH